MSDQTKTKSQLIDELELARLRIQELESKLKQDPKNFETEYRFRVISELTSDCCWVRWIDAEGRRKRMWVTESFQRITGYTPEEFEQIGREKLIHPDDLKHALNHVDGPFGVTELDFRIMHKDGHIAWLRERMRVVPEGDGVCIYGATWDITAEMDAKRDAERAREDLERKVSERTRGLDRANKFLRLNADRIRESERFQKTLSQALESLAADNPVQDVLAILRRGCERTDPKNYLLFYRSNQVGELNLFSPKRLPRPLRKHIPEVAPTSHDIGSTASYLVSQRPVLIAGQHEGMVVCCMPKEAGDNPDHEQRMDSLAQVFQLAIQHAQRKETLLQSQRRLRQVIDLVPHPIIAYDVSGTLVLANRAGAALFGGKPTKVEGKRLDQLHQSPLTLTLTQMPEGSGTMHQSLSPIPNQHFEVFTLPHSDISGVATWVTVAIDTTRQMEVQSQLSEALKQAELANQAKTQFFANVSHELKTPLSTILGICHLLNIHTQPDPEMIRSLMSSAHVLDTLVEDVLDLSRLERGISGVQPTVFDTHGLFHEIKDMFFFEAQRKNLALELKVDAGVPLLFCTDRRMLVHILINILGNAIKFTQTGRVRFRISAPNNQSLLFRVTDTGPGIPQAEARHVFEPFYQLHHRSENPTGAGIGLSIAQKMAHQLNSDITLRSRRGTTTFACTLAALEPKQTTVDQELTTIDRDQYTVLVAEDNVVNQLVAQKTLESLGYHVVCASQGMQVLDCLQNEHIAVIMMDCRMPVLDGYATTQRIRASKMPWANVPIVAVTAHASHTDRQKCLSVGMNAYVSKPYDPHLLADELDRLIIEAEVAREHPQDPVDMKRVHEITDGDPDFRDKIIDLYLENLQQKLEELKQASTLGDRAALNELSHSIKGSAGNMGAAHLERSALLLEVQSSDPQINTSELVNIIEDDSRRVMTFLNQYRRKHQSSGHD